MDSTETLEATGQFVIDSNTQEVSPSTIIKRHPDAVKYLNYDSTMRFRCNIKLSGTILKTSGSDDPSIEFKNLLINKISPDITIRNPMAPNEKFFGSNLRFQNVTGDEISIERGINVGVDIRDSDFRYVLLALNETPRIKITRTRVTKLFILYFTSDQISLTDNIFNEVWFQNVSASSVFFNNNTLENSPFEDEEIIYTNDSTTYMRDMYYGLEPFRIIPGNETIYELQMIGNKFEADKRQANVVIGATGSKVVFRGNQFQGNVILKTRTTSEFELTNNVFSTLSLQASLPSTPQNHVNIDWSDVKEKLVWKKGKDSPTYYGQNVLELADRSNFNSLIATYSKLIATYKNNRNMIDANEALLAVKQLEETRYRYIYQMEGGTANFFRFRLHQLLSFYTQHGTNPAQAITASVWLIMVFGFFYFFFPSDWDPKSKKQLIVDYKLFIQKNDHGYFKPFIKLFTGVSMSLFNAFILSVNSFVTLGFGVIPTKGLAKYVCIIEGFLGWFLLSIFVVSLINQVLF